MYSLVKEVYGYMHPFKIAIIYRYAYQQCLTMYRICSTLGGDFNLAVRWIWLPSPNLMYTNNTYNHAYYKQCTLNIALFAKLKCPPMWIMSQFTKLIVRQIAIPRVQYIAQYYVLLYNQMNSHQNSYTSYTSYVSALHLLIITKCDF